MSHSTVRATIIPEIARLICEAFNCREMEALDMFYSSATGECLGDDNTGLYGQSALFIFGLFKEEMDEKNKSAEQ